MARNMAIIAGILALAASGVPSVAAEPAQSSGDLKVVPKELLGTWKMTGTKCEEGVDVAEGATPGTRPVDATIRFEPDFRYELSVEGWRSVGGYRVEQMRASPLMIQLHDTLYEFDFVDGHLENWSEGDAVYLCARVFERSN